MAPFARRDLDSLLAPQPAPCVSVFLPSTGTPSLGTTLAVRLKSVLRQVDERLRKDGDRSALLEPIAALARPEAWRHRA